MIKVCCLSCVYCYEFNYNLISTIDLRSEDMISGIPDQVIDSQLSKVRETLVKLETNARKHAHISLKELSNKLHFAAEVLIASPQVICECVNDILFYLLTNLL